MTENASAADARIFKALHLCQQLRKNDAEMPFHVIEGLLRVHDNAVVGGVPASTQDIVDSLASTPAAVAFEAIDTLKTMKLIEGKRDVADGRIVRLRPTPKGRQYVADILQAFE